MIETKDFSKRFVGYNIVDCAVRRRDFFYGKNGAAKKSIGLIELKKGTMQLPALILISKYQYLK
ncbi:hypothetical protein D0817_05390 [Flavobacterium cupreum]|uniref:Uncharacterized protein n=2 Tax=Flavobacterium TaxID=237 RepID=A0A4Y7U4M3_9FLAO|nr:hypothetical protein [Flavobacterium]RUT71310.1 hypothetical protein D0817_05390 [Flavobacterium cupreum]TEB41387.1 hypothetical protein D0809_25780 [Flavobacterium circumlabens]